MWCAIIAAYTVDSLRERNVAVSGARRSAENLVESLAQQAADTFAAADGALRTLAELQRQAGPPLASRRRMHDTMKALTATMPRIRALIVVDARGRFEVSNFSAGNRRFPTVLDRAFFRYHRAHRGAQLYISGPAIGKIDKSWVLFVTRRLDDARGRFAGVAIAPIRLSYFTRSYTDVDVGRFGNITLFSADGTVLLRRPLGFIGTRFANAGFLIGPNRTRESGYYIGPSHVDGATHLFAFRRLRGFPLVMLVGLAESEYLADWRADVRAKIVELAVIVTLIGGLAAGLGAQIGQRRRAEESLARLALLDGLTGLANRRLFDDVLEREWRQAARDDEPLALLMIDVDYFKAYNDRYGHPQGDAALVAVAHAISAQVKRPGDLAARYGGEEFVAILRATELGSAITVAERIRAAVGALELPHGGSPENVVTVSIGVAGMVPPHNGAAATLVDAADRALYAAKRTGRNRISMAEPA